jgi:hypothetical protein
MFGLYVVCLINLLEPKTYFMYHQLQHSETVSSAHNAFMCFVWIPEQTAIISAYSCNFSVFITTAESVYCAVQTGFSARYGLGFQVRYSFVLKGLNSAFIHVFDIGIECMMLSDKIPHLLNTLFENNEYSPYGCDSHWRVLRNLRIAAAEDVGVDYVIRRRVSTL